MSFLLKSSLVLHASAFVSQQAPNPPTAEKESGAQQQEQTAPQEQIAPSTPPSSPNQETTRSAKPRILKKQAWEILEAGANGDKSSERAAAVHATGLIPNDPRARKVAEAAIKEDAPEVRAAAAAALGDMHERRSIPKLRAATGDKDASVALAAAHALLLLNDTSGYDVYYEVLTGERKTGKGALAQAAEFKDPKKLAEVGFHQALGFIPFAGLGWQAFQMVKKGDTSPARAAAATVLAKDRDPRTKQALVDAVGDKNWIIRAAALEALAKRGDPSVLGTVELYLSDEEGDVKYTAAATAIRLIAVKQSGSVQLHLRRISE